MTPEVKERIEQIRHGIVPEGYKKTAVGITPNDWKIRRLGDIADFWDDRRIPIKENERVSGTYPYYGASGVIDHVADYIFDGEYILLGEDGANIIERSSPLAFRVSGKCWINNHAHVLSPKDGYHIDYLTNYLESLSYVKYNSGTAQPKLNQDTCQKLPVVCGSFAEQKRIANILTAQDKIIVLKEKLLAEKQRQKKYLMQQLLTGKKRLPGFSADWAEHPLYLHLSESRIVGNNGSNAKKLTVKLWNKGVVEKKEIHLGSESTTYYRRQAGQFIYSKLDFLNCAFGIIPKELDGFESTQDLPCFDIKDIVPQFLLYFVTQECFFKKFGALANGGRKAKRVNPDDFLQFYIAYPSLQEQEAIVQVLATADRELKILEQGIEYEKHKKKALMQLLLTGIVRVKT